MHGCISVEELGAFDALASDHPTRQHVATCARCEAMLLAYRAFVRAEPMAGANVEDADARLDAFISEQVTGRRPRVAPLRRSVSRFRFSVPRVAWGMAAAAAVTLVVLQVRHRPDESIVFRGGSGQAVVHVEVRLLGEGRAEVNWQPVPDADAYTVSSLSEELAVIETLSPSVETTRVVDVPEGGAFLQVTALREGDTIAESQPVPVARERR